MNHDDPTSTSVALRPANPDGKGVSGVMLDLYESTPRDLVAKPRRQLLAEFFTSMLVLSSEYGYRPAAGTDNYLYHVGGRWILSLIAPEQWSDEHRAGFAGTCVLQDDRTWTIEPSARLAEQSDVATAIARFYEAFRHAMATDLPLEDILPFGASELRYHQRIGAHAMSQSIRGSTALGGQQGAPARDWVRQLPDIDRMLLDGPRGD